MYNELLRIKWVASNVPVIELNRDNSRLYPTKKELVEIMKGIEIFINQYPESFTNETIDYTDTYEEHEWFGIGESGYAKD